MQTQNNSPTIWFQLYSLSLYISTFLLAKQRFFPVFVLIVFNTFTCPRISPLSKLLIFVLFCMEHQFTLMRIDEGGLNLAAPLWSNIDARWADFFLFLSLHPDWAKEYMIKDKIYITRSSYPKMFHLYLSFVASLWNRYGWEHWAEDAERREGERMREIDKKRKKNLLAEYPSCQDGCMLSALYRWWFLRSAPHESRAGFPRPSRPFPVAMTAEVFPHDVIVRC